MPPTEASVARSSLADRYRVLLDIGRTLSGTLSPEELYHAIYRETARVVETSGFYISVYDQARDLATVVFYADRDQEKSVQLTYRGSDSEVIRTGKGSLIRDRSEATSLMVLGEEESELTRSAVSAPLRHKGHILGAISTQSYRPDAYTEADLELLQGIADVAAVAVENARQFTELERRRREAEQIEEIGRAVVRSLDSHTVLGTVIDAVMNLLDARGSTVWLLDGTTARVEASAGTSPLPRDLEWDLEGRLFKELVERGRPVLIDDLEASELVPDNVREHLDVGTGLAVPLVLGDRVAGLLSAGSREPAAFDDDDIHILQRLANQASVALENARLHASLQALTLTDPLTNLPNRRHLEMHLSKEVAAASRGRLVTLVIFDVDDFKRFNDSYGHVAGDEALRVLAEILEDENRAMNLVSRYGGDEFVSILTETDAEGARNYVERVEKRVNEDPVLSSHGLTMSAGVAAYDPEAMSSGTDLLQAADDDMYRTKGGRPRRT